MAKAAKKYFPGLGVDYKIQADEIEAGVVIGAMAGFFTIAEVAADFDAASIGRAKLIVDVSAIHGVPLFNLLQPTGIPHDATGGAGLFKVDRTAGVVTLQGQAADSNTKTSVAYFQYVLPDNYKAGGLVGVRVNTKLKSVTGTGVGDNGSDLAVTVLKQAAGAVGANLVASGSPAVYAAIDTAYNKDVVVTPTGLVPGDVLNIQITARAIENNAGNGTLTSVIDEVSVLHDVQG